MREKIPRPVIIVNVSVIGQTKAVSCNSKDIDLSEVTNAIVLRDDINM